MKILPLEKEYTKKKIFPQRCDERPSCAMTYAFLLFYNVFKKQHITITSPHYRFGSGAKGLGGGGKYFFFDMKKTFVEKINTEKKKEKKV